MSRGPAVLGDLHLCGPSEQSRSVSLRTGRDPRPSSPHFRSCSSSTPQDPCHADSEASQSPGTLTTSLSPENMATSCLVSREVGGKERRAWGRGSVRREPREEKLVPGLQARVCGLDPESCWHCADSACGLESQPGALKARDRRTGISTSGQILNLAKCQRQAKL